MVDKNEVYAVITGDIVKSTSLDTEDFESLRENLHDWVAVAKKWKRGVVRGKAEFTRGDSWQLLLADASMALRIGTLIRAGLIAKGADTRFSIGVGGADSISTKRVSLSTGEAFVLSGRGLDEMNIYSNVTIQCPDSVGPLANWLPVVGQLCDSLMSSWTGRQAEIITFALNPKEPKQDEIADSLNPPISRQAVTKALDGANWNSMRSAIRAFEKTDWNAVLKNGAEKK